MHLGAPPAARAAQALRNGGDEYRVAVGQRPPIRDAVLAHDPCSVLRFGPLERVADGLGMVGGGLLDPVEVHGVVDVADLIKLVLAHWPADGVTRRVLALARRQEHLGRTGRDHGLKSASAVARSG
jgi:hypothetical protein